MTTRIRQLAPAKALARLTCAHRRRYTSYVHARRVAEATMLQDIGPWRYVAIACRACGGYHTQKQEYDESERYFYSEAFTTPLRLQITDNGRARKEVEEGWWGE